MWKKKNTWWRPTVMTESVIGKLEEWFAMWFTDVEACLYADIASSTLYDYIEKHPMFSERKEELKNQPKIQAKINIINKLKEKDTDTSKRYLERKSKDEFSTKQEIKEESDTTLVIKRDTEWTS